jgi:hypothetical protein
MADVRGKAEEAREGLIEGDATRPLAMYAC